MNKSNNKLFDIDFILRHLELKERDKVADLGCGSFAYFTFKAARLVGERGKVYAVDIIKNIVEDVEKEAWQQNLKQIKSIWSNLEVYKGTKIESSSLDKALLINTLNQSSDKEAMIKEANRMLKSGGKLLVVDWKLSAAPFGPEPHRRINPHILKEKLKQYNLQTEKEFEAGAFHYAIIFKKI
jgi:ubiquinone/menaquinone biosynthesis C-methylase UbiE